MSNDNFKKQVHTAFLQLELDSTEQILNYHNISQEDRAFYEEYRQSLIDKIAETILLDHY